MDSTRTHEVISQWFDALGRGDLDTVIATLAEDIEFELPMDTWNRVIPYLGKHIGPAAVAVAFGIRAETTEVLEYEVRDLRAEGDTAFAVVYTKGLHTRPCRSSRSRTPTASWSARTAPSSAGRSTSTRTARSRRSRRTVRSGSSRPSAPVTPRPRAT